MVSRQYAIAGLSFALTATVFLTSCAVPAYDEKMDNQLTELQQSMDAGLGAIQGYSLFYERLSKNTAAGKLALEKAREKCGFESSYSFYNDTEARINTLLVRLSVTPDVPQGPVNALTSLQKNFISLKDMHASHQPCLNSVNFIVKRKQLRGDFYPLYSYLLQTKVGVPDSQSAQRFNAP
ncbi:hypothetical protein GJV04_19105 [Enterobacteriaceae bacterium RIT714]|nr:hypothetical protein [Enterobacteriaceae bacterium RIT714]